MKRIAVCYQKWKIAKYNFHSTMNQKQSAEIGVRIKIKHSKKTMEQQKEAPASVPAPPTQSAPVAPLPPTVPPADPPVVAPATPPPVAPTAPEKKKSSPWPWILGGCLLIVLVAIGSMAALGWWGARKVKKEIEKYQPSIDKTRENFDRMNREAAEWEKKSEEFRESVPNPEDFENQFPSGPEGYPR